MEKMMPSDLMDRITLLEARVSLLERRVRREDQSRAIDAKLTKSTAEPISYSVDQPGLIIAEAYEVECDDSGRLFCWVGGTERVQFVFPHAADRRQICCVHLAPHPRVDFAGLRVLVNDEGQKHMLTPCSDDSMELKFAVDKVGAPNVNVLLLNVRGIRPEEIGENNDDRLLTARFYGAEFSEA
jgi:hypothetical protein